MNKNHIVPNSSVSPNVPRLPKPSVPNQHGQGNQGTPDIRRRRKNSIVGVVSPRGGDLKKLRDAALRIRDGNVVDRITRLDIFLQDQVNKILEKHGHLLIYLK